MILRSQPHLIKFLEKFCHPIRGRNEWVPIDSSEFSILKEEKNRYHNSSCYIVGKGPSSVYLSENIFKNGPIIAINQAIYKVEELDLKNPIYCSQCDRYKIDEKCWSKKGTMLLSKFASDLYQEHPSRLVIIPFIVGKNTHFHTSIEAAIYMSKYWGCNKHIFVSCDSMVTGDLTYPEYVGYKQYNFRLINQRKLIKNLCSNYEFITPTRNKSFKTQSYILAS